jgi:hypothetical protein
MPAEIKIDGEYAVEKSTYIVTCAFTDEDNGPVVPATGTWTLTDEDGSVINTREDEVISGLASSVDIVLSGNDLAISAGFTGVSEKRIFTFEGTYNSDLGVGLPLRDQLIFPVYNLGAVT